MPASILQTKSGLAAANSISVTFDNATTAGSVIVAFPIGSNPTSTSLSTLTDNRSGSYTQQLADPIGNSRFDIQAYTNVTGTRGTTHTVTATFTSSGTNDVSALMLYEIGGADLSNILAGSGSLQGSDTVGPPYSLLGPNVTPTANGIHVVGAFFDGGGTGAITPNSGWTEYVDTSSGSFEAYGSWARTAVSGVAQQIDLTWVYMDVGGILHLVIRDGLSVTADPQSVRVVSGNPAYLQIGAIGATTYQWQDNRTGSFANVTDGTGGTTANYITASLTTAATGRQYRCQISDGTTTINSAAATITVDAATTGSLGQFDPELRLLGWW